jgi:DNA-binding NarL/FixJ family response regulator
MSRPRVLLADDHTLLLEAFAKLLADECDVVGAVSDGRALLEMTKQLRPDVVVVDVAMPLLNGIDAARLIKQAVPLTRIVFLTMNEDPDLAAEAFRAGASAYLLKRSVASELLTAIREVVRPART